MAAQTLKSPIQLFQESSQAVKRNLSLFIFLNAVSILGTAWDVGLDIRDKASGSGWQQIFVHTFTGGSGPALNGSVTLLLIFAGVISYLLLAILNVKAAHKAVVDFGEVWETFKALWWKIILVGLVIVVLIVAGLIAFIIPGLYLIGRLALAPAILIDQNTDVMEALNKSWGYTKGHAWPVFLAVGFGVLLEITSVIPFIGPIIATVLAIAYSVAIPIRYFELKGSKSG
jgi:hypothetical protein